MSVCCPSCSAPAVGTEALSACTECASVSLMGASAGMSTLIAVVIGLGVAVSLWRSRHAFAVRKQPAAPLPA